MAAIYSPVALCLNMNVEKTKRPIGHYRD